MLMLQVFADRILIFKDGCIIQELWKQNADRRAFYESIAQEVAKLDTRKVGKYL